MPKQMPSVTDAADNGASENDSIVLANKPYYNANKLMDMRSGSFGMSGSGRYNEARDEYVFWD